MGLSTYFPRNTVENCGTDDEGSFLSLPCLSCGLYNPPKKRMTERSSTLCENEPLGRGDMHNAIRQAVIKFEQDFMGRGPTDVRAFIVRDMVVVRLRGVLTQAERQLAKNADGVEMIKRMRQNLIVQGKDNLCGEIAGITGVKVLDCSRILTRRWVSGSWYLRSIKTLKRLNLPVILEPLSAYRMRFSPVTVQEFGDVGIAIRGTADHSVQSLANGEGTSCAKIR